MNSMSGYEGVPGGALGTQGPSGSNNFASSNGTYHNLKTEVELMDH